MTESYELTTDQAEREASGAHSYGRYLEEFEVGAVYKHWPAKTVTESDDHLFCLITMNHHPLHINDVYAAGSQQGRNVVVGPLVYSLALGMSVADVSGKAIANLATEELSHPAPVFHGDTLYCESEVLEVRPSRLGVPQMAWLNHQQEGGDFSPISQYPVSRGFEKYYGNIFGVVNYFDPFSLVNGITSVENVPEGYYHTDAINDTAVSYIREFSKDGKPFGYYTSWTLGVAMPSDLKAFRHTPRMALFRRQGLEVGDLAGVGGNRHGSSHRLLGRTVNSPHEHRRRRPRPRAPRLERAPPAAGTRHRRGRRPTGRVIRLKIGSGVGSNPTARTHPRPGTSAWSGVPASGLRSPLVSRTSGPSAKRSPRSTPTSAQTHGGTPMSAT